MDHQAGDEAPLGGQVARNSEADDVFVRQCDDIIMPQRGDNEAREKQGRLLHSGKSVWGDREQRLSGKQKTRQSG